MTLTERDVEAYECPACGSLARHEDVPCCDESRDPVGEVVTYDRPEVESVIEAVFDLSSTDLAICRVLMPRDEATATDLATELSLDRTTVNRRLNHLVELGLVEKRPQVLDQGGQVNLYSSVPLDEAHRRLQLGLYRWLADAEGVLDELREEKLELMVREAEVDPTDAPGPRGRGDERIAGTGGASDGDALHSAVAGTGERSDSTGEGATGESDARTDGDGRDSRDAATDGTREETGTDGTTGDSGTDGTMSDDSGSPGDEGGSSLLDRLLGRYRS